LTPEAKKATDPFFGESDLVREELPSDYDHDKSEVHREVEKHLGKDISSDEYVSGITRDKYGREARIGRMIKDKGLQGKFASDNTRAGSKAGKNHYVTIVRGTEVAGQTNSAPDKNHPKGHSWGDMSCKNVDTGTNREYLDDEIRHGSVVVRVHDHNDQEIYRATLHPHENQNGDVAYAVNSEYGVKHPSFTNHAHDVAKRISGKPDVSNGTDMIYNIHPDVYNDNEADTIVHPGATKDHLHAMIDQAEDNIDDFYRDDYKAILNHNQIDDKHLNRLYNLSKKFDISDEHDNHFTSSDSERITARQLKSDLLSHEKVPEKILLDALNSPDRGTRIDVALNKNATEKVLDTALSDDTDEVKRYAVENPNMSEKQLSRVFDHPNGRPLFGHVTRYVASRHPKITSKLIDKIQNDPDEYVRQGVAYHKAHVFNSDQINKAINDTPDTAMSVINGSYKRNFGGDTREIKNSNFTKQHLDDAVKTGNGDVITAAMYHPLAERTHLEAAINHENFATRLAAINHPDMTKEDLQKMAEHDPSDSVKTEAERKLGHRFEKRYKLQKSGEYDWQEPPKGGWVDFR